MGLCSCMGGGGGGVACETWKASRTEGCPVPYSNVHQGAGGGGPQQRSYAPSRHNGGAAGAPPPDDSDGLPIPYRYLSFSNGVIFAFFGKSLINAVSVALHFYTTTLIVLLLDTPCGKKESAQQAIWGWCMPVKITKPVGKIWGLSEAHKEEIENVRGLVFLKCPEKKSERPMVQRQATSSPSRSHGRDTETFPASSNWGIASTHVSRG
ncbi:hypothetical protein DFJ77DRAFT_443784 [Powellomyces hirtus]|nr:hypothetical protein DFJ77DRAFT_443784 [Powellomyces hirtus]